MKRIVSALLVFVMCFGIFGVDAFAAEAMVPSLRLSLVENRMTPALLQFQLNFIISAA